MPHLEAVANNGAVVPRRFFFFSKAVSKGALQNCEVFDGQVCVFPGRQAALEGLVQHPSRGPSTTHLRVQVCGPQARSTQTVKNLPPRRPRSFCYHCLLVSGSAVDILYPKHCWFLNSSFPASGCLQLIHLNYVDINIYAYGKGLFHVSLKHCTFWTSSFYQNK